MPTRTAAILALVAAAGDAAAMSGTEGRAVGESIFAAIDSSGRGAVHAGEIEAFRASAFAGMDSDGSGAVTYDEFAGWDPGFRQVAEAAGRGEAYVTASKIVFADWDRDGDGAMTEREMRFAMNSDFRRADLDDDGLLTLEEFIGGFPIMVAMRAAIRPDL